MVIRLRAGRAGPATGPVTGPVTGEVLAPPTGPAVPESAGSRQVAT